MKTIVEALQDLYVALGGKKADVSGLKLNPDVIEQIAALVNEGALNELPVVTIADAGDVLTVDETGKWGVAAPSGGGKELKTITFDVFSTTEDTETYYWYEANATNNPTLDSDIKSYLSGTCDVLFLFNTSNTGHGFGSPFHYYNPDYIDYGMPMGCGIVTPYYGISIGYMDSGEMTCVVDDGVYQSFSIDLI